MHIKNIYGIVISVTTLILIALSATLVTTISLNISSNVHTTVLAQTIEDSNATLIILPSIGGTTNINPGVYNITAGKIMLAATAEEGFYFGHWVISGHMKDHSERSFFTNNSTLTNPLVVTCTQGNVYRFQAIFTASEKLTYEDLPKGIALTNDIETIVFLGAITFFEAVILSTIYIRHRKKLIRR
jgi:hypothetical protein